MSPIKAWQDFLDSLSTKGGNIFLMMICLSGLMWFVHHLGSDSNIDQSIVSAAHDMMVGFGAALLAVLSGSSSRQQMADRVEVAKGSLPTPSPSTTTVTTEAPLNLSTSAVGAGPTIVVNSPSPTTTPATSPKTWVKR
jgi:hypothetical protein